MKRFSISLPGKVPAEQVEVLNQAGAACGYDEFGTTLSASILSSHQIKESFAQVMQDLHDLRFQAIDLKQKASLNGYIDSFIAQAGVSVVGLLQVITDFHVEQYVHAVDWKDSQLNIANTWNYGEMLFNEGLIDYFGYLHWSILKLNEDSRKYKSGNLGKALNTYEWLLDVTEVYIGLSLDRLNSIRRRKSDGLYSKAYYKGWATNLFALMNHIYELNKSSFVAVSSVYKELLQPANSAMVSGKDGKIIQLSDISRSKQDDAFYFTDRRWMRELESERQNRMEYLLALLKAHGVKTVGGDQLTVDYHEFRTVNP